MAAVTSVVGVTDAITVGVTDASTVGGVLAVTVGSALAATVGSALAVTVGSALVVTLGSTLATTLGSALAAMVGSALAATVGSALAAMVGSALAAMVGSALAATVGSALVATLGSWVGALLGSKVGRTSLQIQICSLLSPHLDALEQLLEFSKSVQSLAPYAAQVAFAKLYVTSVIQSPSGVLAYDQRSQVPPVYTKSGISTSEQHRAPKSSFVGTICGLGTMVH